MLISSKPSSAYMSVQTPKLSLLPLLPSGNHKFDLQVCEYTSALQTSPCIRILVFCILILIILKCSIQCIKHVHNVVPPLPLSNSQTCQQPKCKPSTHSALPHPWPPLVCFLPLWIHLLWTFHINGIIQHVAFSIWFLSFSIMFSRFIHVVACVSTSLPSMAK